LERGVFEIDLKRLTNNPIIIKDENDVYYIRLPVQKEEENPD
jgi:hypothetical protein